jgi:DNA-binding FadR family transcriptional regulator
MKYWLHQMDSAAGDLENHGIAALEIHRTVAETSGNALLRSVTGIVELTLALALRQCASTDATSYLRSSYEALSRLVAAIGDADAEAAMAAVEQVIALDEASVFTALPQL